MHSINVCLSFYLYVFVCPSACISVHSSVCLYLSICPAIFFVCLSQFICLSVCQPIYLYLVVCPSMCLCLSICLCPISPSVCFYLSICLYVSTCPSVCTFLPLSVCPASYLSICLLPFLSGHRAKNLSVYICLYVIHLSVAFVCFPKFRFYAKTQV